MGYALSLAKTTRWTGTVNVSVTAGRLRNSQRIAFGPSVALEIPLFDQRQAQIARLESFKRQGESELQALAIDVRSDVRSTRARVLTARAVVEDYGNVIVPNRESIVKLSQQSYDAMLLGVYQLILAKQNEFQAYREYIEALRDYWIATSDLERAIGGRIAPSHRGTP
jgi:cobalt-zinc-cadmium efflux system outer membrane protein